MIYFGCYLVIKSRVNQHYQWLKRTGSLRVFYTSFRKLSQVLVVLVYINYFYSILMHSKIYKAKMIVAYSANGEQKASESKQKHSSIHTYFGMLQHIFQRNKNLIKSLKLSGTKIQQKNRQTFKGCFRSNRLSEIVSTNIKLQTQFKVGVDQLRREKSLPNHAFSMTSIRNLSVQSRYPSKQSQQVLQEQSQELSQFMPIGQASYRISLTNRNITVEKPAVTTKGVITFNFKNGHGLKQARTEREMVQANKKHSLRVSRKILKIKSEGSQVQTNTSSIRTTRKSYVKGSPVTKFENTPQKMTPW